MTGVAIELRFESRLSAPAETVWAAVSTMRGVNDELRPLLRMTHPRTLSSLASVDVAPRTVLFRSWILLGGVLPIDRHALALERVMDGEGFDEESTTWLQRRWRHERRVVPDGDGTCRVVDRLVVVPRLPMASPVVTAIVRRVFLHRHRRLGRRYGAPETAGTGDVARRITKERMTG